MEYLNSLVSLQQFGSALLRKVVDFRISKDFFEFKINHFAKATNMLKVFKMKIVDVTVCHHEIGRF
jgi:hypothetical protein